MKANEVIGIFCFLIFLTVFMGAGTFGTIAGFVEHGQISGTNAFFLIIALIVILFITTCFILSKLGSGRSDDE